MATEFARMGQLLATTADWAANDIVLIDGEIGFELRTDGVVVGKVGDGVSTYSLLNYTIGGGVDLTTDQIVAGSKTFQDTILIENQTTPGLTAQLYADDSAVAGKHSVYLDSKEIDSNCFIVGRDIGGNPIPLAIGWDGSLYWRGLLIADETGTAGSDWGRFDATGLLVGGLNYTVARLALGQYELVFNRGAEDIFDQSVVANIEAGTGDLGTATVQIIDETTVQIFTTDGTIAADQAVNFSRDYTPIITNIAAQMGNP
jgi:hypothetical protein